MPRKWPLGIPVTLNEKQRRYAKDEAQCVMMQKELESTLTVRKMTPEEKAKYMNNQTQDDATGTSTT